MDRADLANKLFFVAPIGAEGSDERRNSDKVMRNVVEGAASSVGLETVRADKVSEAGKITDQINDYLRQCSVVVADLSGHNPNVMFEFGYRYALGKPVIPLIKKGDTIPFDMKDIRTIFYTNDVDDAKDAERQLTDMLRIELARGKSEGSESTSDDPAPDSDRGGSIEALRGDVSKLLEGTYLTIHLIEQLRNDVKERESSIIGMQLMNQLIPSMSQSPAGLFELLAVAAEAKEHGKELSPAEALRAMASAATQSRKQPLPKSPRRK